MYPFISQLLDCFIRENSGSTKIALRNALAHNQNAYSDLKSAIEKAIQEEYERISYLKEEFFIKEKPRSLEFVLNGLSFNEKYNTVSFRNHYKLEVFTADFAVVTETSKDEKINNLIGELNESYNKIVNVRGDFQNGNI